MASGADDAIVLRGVTKRFKRSTVRKEHTTFKSELVAFLTAKRRKAPPELFIETLRGVDLTIPRGRTVGILGRNGSGKSTLLKLITGIYAPTTGSIEVNGRISALLDLGAGFHPDFTGRENILINGIILGMSRAEVKARMDDIIAFSELGDFIDEPVRTYSSGMYMRLAFSVATHVDPEILIIDEILAVGDAHFSRKSMAKMEEFKRAGRTIVLVTHDLSAVERWCDMAAWIDGGRIRRVGPPGELVREYEEAVRIAEDEGRTFAPSALASDGGALPEVPHHGAGEGGPVTLAAVSCAAGGGASKDALDPEDALEVQVDFTARPQVGGVAFGVVLLREDGTPIYRTSTRAEAVPVPEPLPVQGRVQVTFDRLGLLPGHYDVEVTALAPDGALLAT
ncbi:MAG: polysaccharide ABC transporter ATP-binding protein, partial [Myxococcaceae bacterium]|nr:polysaccharide ABC transporter ATP-binding protein [Myxococcaceae bacterium]